MFELLATAITLVVEADVVVVETTAAPAIVLG
jgi:hypothetical protein